VDLIPPGVGAAAFVRELDAGPGPARVTLVAGDRPDAFGAAAGRTPLGVVKVDAATHPYLKDHAIAGTPVLPMALVVEWFAGAVAGRVLRDLQVVRGVRLPDLAGAGHVLTVHATEEGQVSLACGGQTHYRATAGAATTGRARDWIVAPGRPIDPYAGTVLFHGPAFHCLVEVAGATAVARGVREVGWPEEAWHTDPAAVDAALQLALLWAADRFGAAFLPMGVEEVRLHGHGPVSGRARCVVLPREDDPQRPLCDLAVLDGDGRPRAELLGVSLVRRPGNEG
jgi:hypothetical protein